MKTLVTGSGGFVGKHLVPALKQAGHQVIEAVRAEHEGSDKLDATIIPVGDIGPNTDWRDALMGIDVVVHLAGRAHVMNETEADPEAAYKKINVDGTRRLAEQAVKSGVKRLIFLSSIKVNGEATDYKPFRPADMPDPQDAYGRSKAAAESALWMTSRDSQLAVTVLRSPLIYGAGVKGNFFKLLRAVDQGRILPLGGVTKNRRSLVFVGNLCAAVLECLENPEAANKIYLLSDGKDLSTASLLVRTSKALGRPARLLTLPVGLLILAGQLTFRRETIARLTGSLRIDDSDIRRDLGWSPPYTIEEGLKQTAIWLQTEDSG